MMILFDDAGKILTYHGFFGIVISQVRNQPVLEERTKTKNTCEKASSKI